MDLSAQPLAFYPSLRSRFKNLQWPRPPGAFASQRKTNDASEWIGGLTHERRGFFDFLPLGKLCYAEVELLSSPCMYLEQMSEKS